MTNTDTADVEGDRAAVGRARPRRLRDRAHHGRPRRGRQGRAAHPRPAGADGRGRAAGRRLPLQRPHAARRESGLRRGARQVSHQSRQRRLQGQARPAVLGHRRAGPEARQAGAHRRQLGQPRPGAADPPDGRERGLAGAAGRPRRHARGDRAVGPAVGRARGGAGHAAASRSSSRPRSAPCRTSSASTRMLAARCRYALHLGLTEAGMGSKGIVASTAAMGILLQQGIGDTIRVSLTPEPGGDRTQEVRVAQEILQTMGLRSFVPIVAACPGCGRTTSDRVPGAGRATSRLTCATRMPEWREQYPGVESLNLAVMGCIVNGPGEIQARRHRHLAARHRRGAHRARLHRRQEGHDAARPQHRQRVQGDRGGLRGAAICAVRRRRAARRTPSQQATACSRRSSGVA